MLILSVYALMWAMCIYSPRVEGHGYMISPAGRSSAWRLNATVFPTNYNDNWYNCGGLGTQWGVNNGSCGICGDSYSQKTPRDNERGGFYSTNNIVAQYQSGGVMEVTVKITVNHNGTFYFDLFASNSPNQKEQEALFEPLSLADTGAKFYKLPSKKPGNYTVRLQIPPVTCTNCVVRWKYRAGNSWGCQNGDCCTGCGTRQEHFASCADIMITLTGSEPVPTWVPFDQNRTTTQGTTTTRTTTTTTSTTTTTITPTTTTTTTTTPTTTTTVTTTTTSTSTTTTIPTTTTTISTTTTTTINENDASPQCSGYCKTLCKIRAWCLQAYRLCGKCTVYKVALQGGK